MDKAAAIPGVLFLSSNSFIKTLAESIWAEYLSDNFSSDGWHEIKIANQRMGKKQNFSGFMGNYSNWWPMNYDWWL